MTSAPRLATGGAGTEQRPQREAETPASPVLVSVRNLSKYYVRGDQIIPVLVDIDLDVNAGDYVALMGPSGSGKSTLLNLIAGIDKPSSGEVRVAGVDIAKLSDADLALWRSTHVGFIFQFYNLMPVLTAFGNVELPLQLTSLSRSERRERVATALALVGLSDRATHLPNELSGGQQQRVAIARALITDPTHHRRRRTDRRPGSHDRGGNPRPARAAERRDRQDDHHGDARSQGGREGASPDSSGKGRPGRLTATVTFACSFRSSYCATRSGTSCGRR